MIHIRSKDQLELYRVPETLRYTGNIFRQSLQGPCPGGKAYVFPDIEITLHVDVSDSNLFFSKTVYIECNLEGCFLSKNPNV